MVSKINKKAMRQRRHIRVRGKVSGTPECPRLNVFRSNANIYAQLIDDVNGVTLVSANTERAKLFAVNVFFKAYVIFL